MIQIKISARTLIIKDQSLLLVSSDGTYWCLPGGLLEPSETLKECAVRETFEETGYMIAVEELFYCSEWFDERFDSHKIDCCFMTSIKETPKEGVWKDLGDDQTVTMQKFFTLDELKKQPNVYPVYLKEGTWLNQEGPHNVYQGMQS